MTAREFMQNAAMYLGLLAFTAVAGISYANGVELLFALLRGIGVFFLLFFSMRFFSNFLDSPLHTEAEPASGVNDTESESNEDSRPKEDGKPKDNHSDN